MMFVFLPRHLLPLPPAPSRRCTVFAQEAADALTGAAPSGGLVLPDAAGNLYGTVNIGGANAWGRGFRVVTQRWQMGRSRLYTASAPTPGAATVPILLRRSL